LRNLTLNLNPELSGSETVTLSLYRRTPAGTLALEYSRAVVTASDLPLNVVVQGSGIIEFVLMINGVEIGSEMVHFD